MAAFEGWNGLPIDLLSLVGDKVPQQTFRHLFLVCKAWCLALRQRLHTVQPTFLDEPWRGSPLQGVLSITAPLARSKYEGFTYHMPLRSSRYSPQWFPALQTLDLSGQPLALNAPPHRLRQPLQHQNSLQQTLLQCTTLRALDLSRCKLSLSELSAMVAGLVDLRTLLLSGLCAQDGMLAHAQSRLFSSLRHLPHLSCLDLSLATPPCCSSPSFIFSLTGAVSLLQLLPSLASLTIHRQRLTSGDLASLSLLTGLRDLGFDLYGRDADGETGLSTTAWLPMAQLRALTSLRIAMYGRRGLFRAPALRLPPHLPLQRLGLPGCCDAGMLLSACTLGSTLRELDLSSAWLEDVTPDLIVQVCSCLPNLVALDVSYGRWGSSPWPYGQFALPGDILLSGLSVVAPQLRTLRMLGIAAHGTGFGSNINPSGSGLFQLWDLALPGAMLLRSRIKDLGSFSQLRRLTLADVLPKAFLCASQVGAFVPLGALTALTALRILAPHGAPDVGTLGQPGALHADLAAEEGEPMEDGWVPVEHPGQGQPQLQQQQQQQGGAAAGPAGQQPGQGLGGHIGALAGMLGQIAQVLPPLGQVQAGEFAAAANALGQVLQAAQADGPQDAATADQLGQALAQLATAAGQASGSGAVGTASGSGGPAEGANGMPDGAGAGVGLQPYPEDTSEEQGTQGGTADVDSSAGGMSSGSGDEDMEEAEEADDEDEPHGYGEAEAGPSTEMVPSAEGAPFRHPEPHLLFVSAMLQLQVLVLTCVASSGLCLRHLSGLSYLRVLGVGGELTLTPAGLATIRGLKLPRLQSLQLMTCTFDDAVMPDGVTMTDGLWPCPLQPRSQSAADRGTDRDTVGSPSRPPQHGNASSADGSGAGLTQHPHTAGLQLLLSALTHALPQLEHLELGDCQDLTEDLLQQAVQCLPYLRYLVLHGQPLPQVRCRVALEAACSSRVQSCELRYFASWPGSAVQQVAAGAVHVPGGGGLGGGSSGGGGPWSSAWSKVPASQTGSDELPGASFFQECPPRTPDLMGPQSRGGFMLMRVGSAMLPMAA